MGYLKAALVGATSTLLCTLLLLSTAYARADERAPQSFDIPPQGLAAALSEFARQSHEEILFAPDVVAEKRSGGVRGTMQPLAALKILLNDSALPFSSTPNGAILIGQAGASPVISAAEPGDSSPKEGKKDSSRDFRVAQVAQGSPGLSTVDKARDEESERNKIAEIIVTAQKRSERLQDVPVPVTAISGDTLADSNELKLQDYFSSVPALNFTQDFRGGPVLSIRGISSGALSNPTIGVVIDDVPYGASTSLGGGFTTPDFDPGDLARVEVLRGPQGTLYGANSVGGLFKYVTIDPSTGGGVSGRVQGGLSGVQNGNEPGYNVRGAINVPLSDTWAVRASAFARRDPGYIDNPVLGINGLNRTDADGGRLSLMWKPSQDFSLKLAAMLQDSKRYGASETELQPALGDLQQNFPLGSGTYDSHTRFYSATVNAKLGAGIDLMALTGYSQNTWSDNPNYTFPPWDGLAKSVFGVTADTLPETNETKKFSQEIRLSVPLGQRIDWLIGAFYTHEQTDWEQHILAVDPTTGAVAGSGLDYAFGPTTYEEHAEFTDVTVKVTDRFDVQLGGRESQYKQKHDENGVYAFFGGFVFAPPTTRTEADALTYLVTPRFKVSEDLMLYARLASGYRVGGPNYLTSATHFPLEFQPDKTINYEVGIKGNVLDHALSFDASAYYIDWKDLQVIVSDPASGLTGYVNAGRAKSQGVELSAESKPLPGLTIDAWVALNDAVLTQDFPAGAGKGFDGDRLPYASRFSGHISLEQEFPIKTGLTGFAGTSLSYVGNRTGTFSTSTQGQQIFPGYGQLDLRAGVLFGAWKLNTFVTNATNKRGILNVDPNVATNVYYIQPRTVGAFLSKSF